MSGESGVGSWRLGRPYVVRHFLLPGLAGVLAGLVCVGALLALDMGGLRTLILAGRDGWVALPLLGVGFGVTFGSAAIGASVMAIGQD
jgi:hypothetical protein